MQQVNVTKHFYWHFKNYIILKLPKAANKKKYSNNSNKRKTMQLEISVTIQHAYIRMEIINNAKVKLRDSYKKLMPLTI